MSNNIVMISDEKYLTPTIVAITSIVNNIREKETIVYVLCDGIIDENKKILKNMESSNVKINLIDVDSSKYTGMEKNYSLVSKASLLKFSIPDILREVDKVLYVDGDILICKDISPIFETNIDNIYAAVIKDGPKTKIAGGKRHDFYGNKDYFNSGVMYLNLKKMRDEEIPKKLINYRLNEYNYFMDQDAFNIVFNKNVKYINVKYDFMLHLLSFRNENFSVNQLVKFYELKEYKTVDELLEDVYIFHYTFEKPWKYYDIPLNELWMTYYNKSPLKNKLIYRKSYLTQVIKSKTYKVGQMISRIFLFFKFNKK